MINEKGEIQDKYIPRKCSATNRLIVAKDHASVQIEIAEVSNNFTVSSLNCKRQKSTPFFVAFINIEFR